MSNKKNKIAGIYATVGLHAILLLFCFFVLAWTEPDPPIPEYGIEFSLGNALPVESQNESESIEESQDDSQEEVEPLESDSAEPDTEELPENSAPPEESVEEPSESVEEEATPVEDVNSPDVVEEVKNVEETPSENVNENAEVKSEEKSEEEVKENNPKKEESEKEKEEPKVDDRAIFKKSNASSSSSSSGNKGASLDLSGWMWDFLPEPKDESDESGKIVFQISVDDEGEIIGVKTLEKTISPALEKVYKEAVRELTFSPTSDNRSITALSTGKITFIIQSK